MTRKRTSRPKTMQLCLGMLSCFGLVACPLTDKYYIEKGSAGGSKADSGGTGGTDTAPSGAGGFGGTNGTTDAGTGGGSGNSSVECDASNCAETCCSNVCADLESDAAHCGRCGDACPKGRYCRNGECYGWTAMTPPPASFVPREKAAVAVIDETKLFVFGGLDEHGNALNSGAIYDAASDSWSLLPQDDTVPSPRQLASAFWTGLRVFVMGGRDATSSLAYTDGARYDPETNSWLTVPPLPLGRVAPWGIPAASYIMLWGGLSASGTPLSGGERYIYGGTVPTAGWTSITTTSYTPERVTEAAWGTTENFGYLFGGRVNGTTKSNRGFLYNTSTNSWSIIPNGPSARWGAFGTCDGTAFFIWGGRDETTVMADGYRYGAGWTNLTTTNAPSPRWAPHRRTGWAFAFSTGQIAIVGGMDLEDNPLTDGASYNRATDSWSQIGPWPSQEAHEYGVAALVDGEIIVWGGRNGAVLTSTGERYLP